MAFSHEVTYHITGPLLGKSIGTSQIPLIKGQ